MKKSHPVKILMFGWEFPPFNSGGLGVACEGLVRGLASCGAKITFVLPKPVDCASSACCFEFGEDASEKIRIKKIDSLLTPYVNSRTYGDTYRDLVVQKKRNIYARDLVSEVMRYAENAKRIAKNVEFDVIHCHDWLSFPAGLAAKEISGRPLVFHVHATEFDRVGEGSLNPDIYVIEKEGFKKADAVVAVSEYTKRVICDRYGVDQSKVRVVPNAIQADKYRAKFCDLNFKKNGKKIVLFVGRFTYQKGPDYFLRAARRVLEKNPEVYFVFSGSGDMERWLISESARLNISDKVIFAGFLRGSELIRLYQMADLYVMPSVSEPFGLTSLEAMASGTPILVARTSGASEMISHCLKVDFWDTDQMAAKMLAVVNYPALGQCLSENGSSEVDKFSWRESAEKCLSVYGEVRET